MSTYNDYTNFTDAISKYADWDTWEENYLRKAVVKGFYELLMGIIKVPGKNEWLNFRTPEGRRKKKVREQNDEVYKELLSLTCREDNKCG